MNLVARSGGKAILPYPRSLEAYLSCTVGQQRAKALAGAFYSTLRTGERSSLLPIKRLKPSQTTATSKTMLAATAK